MPDFSKHLALQDLFLPKHLRKATPPKFPKRCSVNMC